MILDACRLSLWCFGASECRQSRQSRDLALLSAICSFYQMQLARTMLNLTLSQLQFFSFPSSINNIPRLLKLLKCTSRCECHVHLVPIPHSSSSRHLSQAVRQAPSGAKISGRFSHRDPSFMLFSLPACIAEYVENIGTTLLCS
jgi:hypothetical protein